MLCDVVLYYGVLWCGVMYCDVMWCVGIDADGKNRESFWKVMEQQVNDAAKKL